MIDLSFLETVTYLCKTHNINPEQNDHFHSVSKITGVKFLERKVFLIVNKSFLLQFFMQQAKTEKLSDYAKMTGLNS